MCCLGRDQINDVLRVKLDETTERWGMKITTVEIREIEPPRGYPRSDEPPDERRARSARRSKRKPKASAKRLSNAPKAASNQPSSKPKGRNNPKSCKAEGERQAQMLRAEGYAMALKAIYEQARRY